MHNFSKLYLRVRNCLVIIKKKGGEKPDLLPVALEHPKEKLPNRKLACIIQCCATESALMLFLYCTWEPGFWPVLGASEPSPTPRGRGRVHGGAAGSKREVSSTFGIGSVDGARLPSATSGGGLACLHPHQITRGSFKGLTLWTWLGPKRGPWAGLNVPWNLIEGCGFALQLWRAPG